MLRFLLHQRHASRGRRERLHRRAAHRRAWGVLAGVLAVLALVVLNVVVWTGDGTLDVLVPASPGRSSAAAAVVEWVVAAAAALAVVGVALTIALRNAPPRVTVVTVPVVPRRERAKRAVPPARDDGG